MLAKPKHRVLVCAALALLSCAKTAHQPTGAGGADNPVDLTAGDGGKANTGPTCSHCPSAEHVQPCCDEYCGYLNIETAHCEPSVAGSQLLLMVAPGEGELCPTRFDCESDPDCPAQQPTEGSTCSAGLTCSYCQAPRIPRAVACRGGQWLTLGPHPACGYTTEP